MGWHNPIVTEYQVVEVVREETETTRGEMIIMTQWLRDKTEAQEMLDELQRENPHKRYKLKEYLYIDYQ